MDNTTTQKHFLIKLLLWAFFSGLLLFYAFTQKPYPTGDAAEYILMTEALINHQTADIRVEDFESFYTEQAAQSNWDEFGKKEFFNTLKDTIINFKTGKTDALLNKEWVGFVGSNKRKLISIHFFVYSLLNVPMRLLLKPFKVEPLKVFQITNVLLLSLCLAYLIFVLPFGFAKSIGVFFLVLFCPAYWYLGWVHADVMICIFTLMGMLLFYTNKPLMGMFLVALAGTQNQPLVFLLMYMALVYAVNHKFNLLKLVQTFTVCIVILWPVAYNYYHFGVFSLISKSGYTGSEYVTFTRFKSFFFDLNQGMIYGLIFILPYFGWLILRSIFRLKWHIDMLLIPVVLGMVYGFSILKMWNMGQAIISRYAAWVAMIFLAYFLHLVMQNKVGKRVFWAAVVSHVAIFLMVTPVPKNLLIPEWDNGKMKWVSRWFLNHYPQWYNPDPDIFGVRVAQKHPFWSDLPIIYTGDDGKIKKVLIKKGNPEKLIINGFDTAFTIQLQQQAKYNKQGYAYINADDFYLKK
jgi:hypothetical protein